MASAEVQTLSSSALGGLIRLRMMFDRSLREANDSSEPGRHIALVTLDGACEYAIRFSAHHHGLSLKPQADFHECIREVRKLWGSQSGPSGLRGVLELHAARNQTQHMGLLPDAELMSRWVVDAKAFIDDVVSVAFGVQLGDVMLAAAIRDDELRELLSQAERELNAGSFVEAFLHADDALSQTRLRWQVQHDYARRYPSHGLPTAGEALDLVEVQMFAADITAYTQLLTTRRHVETGGPEPDATEARSALLFAFDWILRWEVFTEGYPTERYAEYWQSVGPPELDDGGPPRIAWHVQSYRLEAGAGREEQYEMLLQLANIPSWRKGTWGVDLSEALASAETEVGHKALIMLSSIDAQGVLRVRVAVSADPNDVTVVLNRAVEIATERYERRGDDMTAARKKAGELRDTYVAAVRDAATGRVFGEATVTPELSSTGIRYTVALTVLSASPSELNMATSIFSSQGGYLAAASQQAGKIIFEAFPPDEETAFESLTKAIRDSEEELLRLRKITDEHELERQSFIRGIENLLGSPPADIDSAQVAEQDDSQ